jgi:uncharacterized protein (TIGR03083 family)
MSANSAWPQIHSERRALLADLQTISEADWTKPSLCAPWTIRDVFGHITDTARMSPPRFFIKFARAGFSFDRMFNSAIARERQGSSSDALGRFRAIIDRTGSPPGPIDAMLGEIIVHGEDIRRPLGLSYVHRMEDVTRTADFYKGSNLLIGAKTRIQDLTVRATDTGWSTGSGPEIAGPMISLVLAMTGRGTALSDLTGDGVEVLKGRIG